MREIIVEETKLDIIGFRAGYFSNPKQPFSYGFLPKGKGNNPLRYRSYLDEFYQIVGDMCPGSSNCCTRRLDRAALFPCDKEWQRKLPTYIYIVYVENGFNTSEEQREDVLSMFKVTRPDFARKKNYIHSRAWILGMEEFATKSIPAKHVLGYVKCVRHWHKIRDCWQHGGTFELKRPVHRNRNISTQIRQRAGTVLNNIEKNFMLFSQRGILYTPNSLEAYPARQNWYGKMLEGNY